MICPKCGADNTDDSVFCSKCGNVLEEKNNNIISRIILKIKGAGRKTKIIGTCSIVLIILVLIAVFYYSNPVMAFENDVRDNKSTEAIKTYNEKIKGDTDKENKINAFLKNDINKIQKSFSEEEIDYDTAKSKLVAIQDTNLVSSEVNEALSKINNLNNSRIAFSKAEDYLKNKDIVNALKEYQNVIKNDKNYGKAQKQISSNKKQFKEQVLKNADNYANSTDYDKALDVVNEALTVIPNDTDIVAKKAIYEKAQAEKLNAEKQQKIKKLINEQEVSVQNIGLNKDWLDDYYLSITVKNNSNKVVKDYVIGWMGFDANGFPVKTGWLEPDFLQEGHAEAANIQPGNTFGADKGWELTGGFDKTMGASKFIACVKEVDYYDGSQWTNEYYNYWKDEYLGKQYH